MWGRHYPTILVDHINQYEFDSDGKRFASRVAHVAQKVFDSNQMEFFVGGISSKAFVVIHEVLHEIRCWREEVFILITDFERVYDRVRWDFLE